MTPLPAYLTAEAPTDGDWAAFLAKVATDFGCATGTLHRFDPADQHLKLVAHLGIPPQLMPVIQSIPVGKGIAGVAAERREAVELCNLQTDTSGVAKPGAKQTQVMGSLAVPVLDGDTAETLAARVLKAEHILYPQALRKIAGGMFETDEASRLISLG